MFFVLNAEAEDHDWLVRSKRAEALGKEKSQKALEELLILANDKDQIVRFYTAKALGQYQGPEVLEALSRLANDPNSSVQFFAAESLENQERPEAFQVLLVLAKKRDKSPFVVKALGHRKEREAFRTLCNISLDISEDFEVRCEAIAAIGTGWWTEPEALETLLVLAKDKNKSIRTTTAIILGKLPGPAAVNMLLSLTTDENWHVRLAAADALGKKEGPEVVNALLSLEENDENPDVRRAAQRAIGKQIIPSPRRPQDRRPRRSRPDRGEVLLPFPSREVVIENGSSLSRILLAEEIKELWFSLTEWDSQRIVDYNRRLIENPVEVLMSLEGFVLSEKAAQKALGFQNGQALDIRFLEKWPKVHVLAKAVKRHLPMAIAMAVMDSLRKIAERKDVLEHLEKADLVEKELFYVEVNNAILQSIILYANASCDVMTDLDTYKGISRRVGQFIVAGNVVYYGKKIAKLGKLYCQGAKARAVVEAGSMSPPGYVALTLDLAATLIIESYINDAVDSFIRWWEEWGYTAKIKEAQELLLQVKRDANREDRDFISAVRNLRERVQDYEDYLMKDVKLALLKGEMGAKGVEDYYQERIDGVRNRRPFRRYGEYKVYAMGRSGTQYGEIEESYEILQAFATRGSGPQNDKKWRIKRVPVFDGAPSQGVNGYWGSVSTPAQFQQMTEEEFVKYTEAIVQENEKHKNESGQSIRGCASRNALEITEKVYEILSLLIEEQKLFLRDQFPSINDSFDRDHPK